MLVIVLASALKVNAVFWLITHRRVEGEWYEALLSLSHMSSGSHWLNVSAHCLHQTKVDKLKPVILFFHCPTSQ